MWLGKNVPGSASINRSSRQLVVEVRPRRFSRDFYGSRVFLMAGSLQNGRDDPEEASGLQGR